MSHLRVAVVPFDHRLVVGAVSRNQFDAFIVDAAEPSSAIRAELQARRLRVRSIAIGLPRAAAVVKPIDLPEVAGELDQMVRFELDRHLPFPVEDAPFDFTVLPDQRGGPGGAARRVLVAAADRRVVDGALRILQGAGLRPASITVAAHDLIALVRPLRKQRVVWVHYVGADADLLFLWGSSLVLSRQVPAGTDEEVAAEIRRSLSVVRWRGCDAIWLSGDAAPPGGPSAGPLSQFGVPVAEPLYTPRARRLLSSVEGESRGVFMLALGVALGRRGRPLDLIPPALKPRRLTRAQVLTVANVAAALVLIVAALLVTGYRDQQRLAAVNADIGRLEPEVRAVERIRDELDRKTKLAQTIQGLSNANVRPLPVLRELTEILPAEAWLTLVSLDAKGVELTGQAAAASALIPLLENSPKLERVEFASPVTRGRDREQFRIQAKWEAGPDTVAAASTVQPAARTAPGAGRGQAPVNRRPRAGTDPNGAAAARR